MTASRWSVVGRAAVIALVGFLLGFLELPADNILVYYGLFFLLAVPFLALPVRHLLLCAALFAVVAPFVMQWSLAVLPAHVYANPSLLDLVTDPVTVLSQLLLTGTYPALPWMTFLLTGIAIGRTDLSDLAAQARLVAAGAGLAVLAWGTSMASLMLLGGYDAIARATPSLEEWQIDEIIVFGPDPSLPTSTLLWLLVPAPHSNTPFGLALSLGVAVCLLGVFLLLSRGARALLAPLAAMGSMTFTLYTSHLLFLWFGVYEDAPLVWFWLQIAACAAFALVWQRAVGQGPLEKVVSTVARGIRRRVLARDTATATPA